MTRTPVTCPTRRALLILAIVLGALALAPRPSAKAAVTLAPGGTGAVGTMMLGTSLGSPLRPWEWVPVE
jgi:hypothetical protein